MKCDAVRCDEVKCGCGCSLVARTAEASERAGGRLEAAACTVLYVVTGPTGSLDSVMSTVGRREAWNWKRVDGSRAVRSALQQGTVLWFSGLTAKSSARRQEPRPAAAAPPRD